MKKIFSKSIFAIVTLVFLVSNVFSQMACINNSPDGGNKELENLRQDKEWIENLNRYLKLGYAEDREKAAFNAISQRNILP